ncbi:hypothetical protein [Haloterrigena turkmenica]|uniref:hypothetical protein n=1 Tax=Haloterrigena turkmenica TaxID=62320 RepID=UPI00373AF491
MNRRNVLVGLGTIVAGGGAALGTGAFSSVEATRTMTVGFNNDSAAELVLNPTSSYATTETNNDSSNGSSTLKLAFNDLNDNATTTFTDVFEVENNDSNGNAHSIYVKNSGQVDGSTIDFQVNGSSIVGGAITATTDIATSDGPVSIDIVIDSSSSISNANVTIVAD